MAIYDLGPWVEVVDFRFKKNPPPPPPPVYSISITVNTRTEPDAFWGSVNIVEKTAYLMEDGVGISTIMSGAYVVAPIPMNFIAAQSCPTRSFVVLRDGTYYVSMVDEHGYLDELGYRYLTSGLYLVYANRTYNGVIYHDIMKVESGRKYSGYTYG